MKELKQSEIMNGNNLPPNWSWVKLGDVGEVIAGGTPSTKVKEYFDGDISWITPADLTGYKNKYISKGRRNITNDGLKNSSARLVPGGSILFSSRAPIGYVVIASNPLSTNQGFKNLVPNEKVYNEFIYYYLKSAKHLAERNASGTTFKEISAKNFANLPFPLPPIDEQQKIVSKIEELFSELDSGVASLKKAKEQIKTYRQAVLASAFSGRLNRLNHDSPDSKINRIQTQDESGKSHNPVNPSSDNFPVELEERLNAIQEVRVAAEMKEKYSLNLDSPDSRINRIKTQDESGKSDNPVNHGSDNFPNELPEGLPDETLAKAGWRWVKLEDISEKITDGEHIRPNVKDKGIPFLSAKDIRDNGVLFNDTLFISESDAKKFWNRCNPEIGDILIVSRGATVGRLCILKSDRKFCLLGSVILIKVKESINSSFVAYMIKSPQLNKQIISVSGATAQQAIYLRDIKNIRVPLPPFNRQNEVVEEIEKRFSEADNLEKAIDESLAKAETLRQAILKQAFEGRLVNEE